MNNNNNLKIKPCKKWQEENQPELPGYQYSGEGDFNEWDFPCFTYDPMNKTSQKQAMTMAYNTGVEKMKEIMEEIEKEKIKEKFIETVKGDEDYD